MVGFGLQTQTQQDLTSKKAAEVLRLQPEVKFLSAFSSVFHQAKQKKKLKNAKHLAVDI